MSACEKCWADANHDSLGGGSQTEAYHRLLRERQCTPEEQAGPDATVCPHCQTRTRHQVTGQCMRCGKDKVRDYDTQR